MFYEGEGELGNQFNKNKVDVFLWWIRLCNEVIYSSLTIHATLQHLTFHLKQYIYISVIIHATFNILFLYEHDQVYKH